MTAEVPLPGEASANDALDGLLVVHKPAGPTSHDVVAQVRRVLCTPRVGHTGTLDPAADGVLVLVLGRATRLARYLGDEKEYMATIQIGTRTDSYDATGTPVGSEHAGPFPEDEIIEDALGGFRGTFLQRPPLFSAKHVAGQRGHAIGRRERRAGRAGSDSVTLEPVSVTVHRLDLIAVSPPLVTLNLVVAAGFYVRSLAHDLGERLHTGAHLAALTRTRVGPFVLDHAVSLEALAEPTTAQSLARTALVPMSRALPRLEAVTVTAEGAIRVARGQDIGAEHVARLAPADAPPAPAVTASKQAEPGSIRVLNEAGDLLALAERRPTADGVALHPSVVLV